MKDIYHENARRWYDKDPILKEALELLRLSNDEQKEETDQKEEYAEKEEINEIKKEETLGSSKGIQEYLGNYNGRNYFKLYNNGEELYFVEVARDYVMANAIVMANAYNITGESKYYSGAAEAMDYIFGRNNLGLSFVTGYGKRSATQLHHQKWAGGIVPDGVVTAGHVSVIRDNYMKIVSLAPEVL